jgi:hypothetical protein
MTSQEHVGGDVSQVAGEGRVPATAPEPDAGKPRGGKILIYVIVAVILIGACSVMSKEGGGDPESGTENAGFFSKIFGGSDEDADEGEDGGTPAEDEFSIPDGKG